MKPVELCEPAFRYICQLSRIARNGGNLDFPTIRQEVKELLKSIREKASSEVLLKQQFEKIRLPLIFFLDTMIVETGLEASGEWHVNRLAFDENELSGDEAFFDFLEKDLQDPSEEATDRLAVYYLCLGLGYTGFYATQPEFIVEKMRQLSHRLRSYFPPQGLSRITPEAYENVNRANLVEKPAPKLFKMVVAFLILFLAVMVSNIILYRSASRELAQAVETINDKPDLQKP